MKLTGLLLFIFLAANGVLAQERQTQTRNTSAPVSSKFEMIQVFLRQPILLKLDKNTGDVYELAPSREMIKEKGQSYAWQLTRWQNRTPLAELDTTKVNFQIFATSSFENTAYLLNLNTGETWTLVRDLDVEKESYWVPLKNQKR